MILCVESKRHDFQHSFILGTNLERAQRSLSMIGPAVMNGGTTTFLAVILLCDSTSHGLITFFKVFFLTVLFGIFHAIVFLPVLFRCESPFSWNCCKKEESIEQGKNFSKNAAD